MEHRLILGGEQFLPFARSCVAKLKKLGLPYADQSFEVDGASIKVRIEPGHEYIRIESGLTLFSGAVRYGSLYTYPVVNGSPTSGKKVLREFKATAECAQNILHDSSKALSFNETEKMAVEADPGSSFPPASMTLVPAQAGTLMAGMYTGKMRKAVQVLLGTTTQIKYDYRFETTHGIHTDARGKRWLIEVSRANGVIAMPFPVIHGGGVPASCRQEFGGIPSGESFPADVQAAINNGSVIRLATASDLSGFYDKLTYTSSMGWSFNRLGTEAHNTCYSIVTPTIPSPITPAATTLTTAYHYKLDISITYGSDGQAAGAAVLSVVSSGQILRVKRIGWPAPAVINTLFWNPENRQFTWHLIGEEYADLSAGRCVNLGETTFLVGFDKNDVLFTVKRRLDLSMLASEISAVDGEPVTTANFDEFVVSGYDLEITKKPWVTSQGGALLRTSTAYRWVMNADNTAWLPTPEAYSYSETTVPAYTVSYTLNPYAQYLVFPLGYRDGFSIITDAPYENVSQTNYDQPYTIFVASGWPPLQDPANNPPGSLPQSWVRQTGADPTNTVTETPAHFSHFTVPVDGLDLSTTDPTERAAIRYALQSRSLNFVLSVSCFGQEPPQYAATKDLSIKQSFFGALLASENESSGAFYNFIGYVP